MRDDNAANSDLAGLQFQYPLPLSASRTLGGFGGDCRRLRSIGIPVRAPFHSRFSHYLVAAAWPIYLCVWIRKIDRKSISLYWALASFITGFLFSWILWIVVIFEVREELLAHYNRREAIGLRLNWFLTLLFSFAYFQYNLRAIAEEKEGDTEEVVEEAERFIIP